MNREPKHNSSTPFPDEIAHLAEIMERLDQALVEAEADVGRFDREYRAAKRYMAEYRGEIDGELIRKQQFRIKDSIMEYTLESFDNVQDDVLQRELSHTSDEKMKSIIATIQKEQTRILRNKTKER